MLTLPPGKCKYLLGHNDCFRSNPIGANLRTVVQRFLEMGMLSPTRGKRGNMDSYLLLITILQHEENRPKEKANI